MTGLLSTLIPFFGVLLVLVVVHELGHFVTAKIAGVKVLEFGFGYPPKLFGIRRGETEYTFNLLPLGGFVKLAGEEDPSEERSFAGKSVLTRLIILIAGPGMNALLPIILLTATFLMPHQVVTENVQVASVMPGSPAEQAGMQPDDVIAAVQGKPIENRMDLVYATQLNMGSPIEITLERGGQTRVVTVVPRWSPPAGEGAVGVVMSATDTQVTTASLPFFEAVGEGTQRSFELLVLFKNGIVSTIARSDSAALAGPVGIAQVTGEVAKEGVAPFLEWAALLSMNLAVLNILPIPMLDGGRVAFVLLEWLRRGRRISPQREGLVHLVGFVILMGLIAVITYNDIARLISGENIIP